MAEEATAELDLNTEQAVTPPVDDSAVTEPSAGVLPEGHWASDDSYYDGLDDDAKEATQKLAARFDSPAKQLAAHLSAQQLRGQSIRLPKADATQEEKDTQYRKIFTKMGCPEAQENYDVPSDILPEGFTWSEDAITGAKDMAWKNGLSQDAFKSALSFHANQVVALKQAFAAQQEQVAAEKKAVEQADWDKAMSVLKKDWGADFEKRIEKAKSWADNKWDDKLTRMRFCYEQYIKDFSEGKMLEGSGAGQPVKGVFDSHEGE